MHVGVGVCGCMWVYVGVCACVCACIWVCLCMWVCARVRVCVSERKREGQRQRDGAYVCVGVCVSGGYLAEDDTICYHSDPKILHTGSSISYWLVNFRVIPFWFEPGGYKREKNNNLKHLIEHWQVQVGQCVSVMTEGPEGFSVIHPSL